MSWPVIRALLLAVAAFIVAKVLIAAMPMNETFRLVLTTAVAAVIAGVFTRHLRRG